MTGRGGDHPINGLPRQGRSANFSAPGVREAETRVDGAPQSADDERFALRPEIARLHGVTAMTQRLPAAALAVALLAPPAVFAEAPASPDGNAVTVPAPAKGVTIEGIAEYRLANGLRVLL